MSEWWIDPASVCFRKEGDDWPSENFRHGVMVRVDRVQDFWALPKSNQMELLERHGLPFDYIKSAAQKLTDGDVDFIFELSFFQRCPFHRRGNAWCFEGYRITNCEGQVVKKFVVYL